MHHAKHIPPTTSPVSASQQKVVELVSSYNNGTARLCVTMLGKQIDEQGFDQVVNDKAVYKIENEFVRRSKIFESGYRSGSASNFSAAAFDRETHVSLLRSVKYQRTK